MTAHIYLIANRWQCPDGITLQSKHRHDCVTHTDTTTGEFCLVDGGCDYYIRTAGNLKNLCVYSNDAHELKREFFLWGNRGVGGKEPLQWVALKDLTTEHIEAIIETQEHLHEHILHLFEDEIEYRKVIERN